MAFDMATEHEALTPAGFADSLPLVPVGETQK
jgi:hypothetical protein